MEGSNDDFDESDDLIYDEESKGNDGAELSNLRKEGISELGPQDKTDLEEKL